MNERVFYNSLLIVSFAIALIVFIVLFFISAPYGRHLRKGWGLTISNKLAWIVMEAPSPMLFAAFFLIGNNATAVTVILLGLWEAHYIHRAFVYPFSLRGDRSMPAVIVIFGLAFNLMNVYLNGRYIFSFSTEYTVSWLTDPRFILGIALFVSGVFINRAADKTLRALRKPGEDIYSIPNTGLYRWISCPNYFGEIIIWSGWALATWSLPGLAFAIWTVANLAPRARSHHVWYLSHFPDYPAKRKVLLPKVW